MGINLPLGKKPWKTNKIIHMPRHTPPHTLFGTVHKNISGSKRKLQLQSGTVRGFLQVVSWLVFSLSITVLFHVLYTTEYITALRKNVNSHTFPPKVRKLPVQVCSNQNWRVCVK